MAAQPAIATAICGRGGAAPGERGPSASAGCGAGGGGAADVRERRRGAAAAGGGAGQRVLLFVALQVSSEEEEGCREHTLVHITAGAALLDVGQAMSPYSCTPWGAALCCSRGSAAFLSDMETCLCALPFAI